MNKLTKTILAGLFIFVPFIWSFHYNALDGYKFTKFAFAILAGRYLFGLIGMLYLLEVGSDLKELINIKYRIVKEPEFKYVRSAQYLTLNTLFFPVWKPVSYEIKSYEVQNMFGATWNRYYDSENTFTSEQDAINAIEKHKIKCKENRQEWLESSKKTKPTIKYL